MIGRHWTLVSNVFCSGCSREETYPVPEAKPLDATKPELAA